MEQDYREQSVGKGQFNIVGMKKLYPGYYPYTNEQIKEFIKEANIVFGASVLLDLFRISHSRLFLDLIDTKISKERLWLPYDTVWLYHNRLVSVIEEQIEDGNNASKHLNAFKESINNKYGHPYITQDLMTKFDKFISEAEAALESDRKFLLSCLLNNDIKNKISKLFHNRIGTEYDATRMMQVFDESKKRNEEQIPPCMTFSSSTNPRIKHNRYVVWKQIQQYAKSENKPILIVLNRITPNWFFIYKDKVVTPHQALINEFKQETGQNVYILSVHDFLTHLLTAHEKENPEIQKLLSQLHEKSTPGNSQKIAPITSNNNAI